MAYISPCLRAQGKGGGPGGYLAVCVDGGEESGRSVCFTRRDCGIWPEEAATEAPGSAGITGSGSKVVVSLRVRTGPRQNPTVVD